MRPPGEASLGVAEQALKAGGLASDMRFCCLKQAGLLSRSATSNFPLASHDGTGGYQAEENGANLACGAVSGGAGARGGMRPRLASWRCRLSGRWRPACCRGRRHWRPCRTAHGPMRTPLVMRIFPGPQDGAGRRKPAAPVAGAPPWSGQNAMVCESEITRPRPAIQSSLALLASEVVRMYCLFSRFSRPRVSLPKRPVS